MTATGTRESSGRAFLAILRRDLYVSGRELPAFLAQTLLQPFFFLLIFVVVLGRGGFVAPDYAMIMLPGLLTQNCSEKGLKRASDSHGIGGHPRAGFVAAHGQVHIAFACLMHTRGHFADDLEKVERLILEGGRAAVELRDFAQLSD